MTPAPVTPDPITLTPIGTVVGGRVEPVDDNWDAVHATVVLDAEQLGDDATAGLEAFSHLDVKAHFAEMGPRGKVRQPDWSREIMRGYWYEDARA